jgi:small GTP-binding protein
MAQTTFVYDVFLSCCSTDRAEVGELAKRLQSDGCRVWFHDWEIDYGHDIQSRIEQGLEQSRVLLLCISRQALGSEWPELQAGAFRFRDPLNQDRRFIPLRLGEVELTGPLAQIHYVDWSLPAREKSYPRLRDICRANPRLVVSDEAVERSRQYVEAIQLDSRAVFCSYAFADNGGFAVSGNADARLRYWDTRRGRCNQVFGDYESRVLAVALSADQGRVLAGSADASVRIWNLASGLCDYDFAGHLDSVTTVAWHGASRLVLSGSADESMRVWDLETRRCLQILRGQHEPIECLAVAPGGQFVLSAGARAVRLWNLRSGDCRRLFRGHTGKVSSVAWSPGEDLAVSGSADTTVRVWNVRTGKCLHVLEGHTAEVTAVSWGPSYSTAISASRDGTIRLWNVDVGHCVRVLEGHRSSVRSIRWNAGQSRIYSGDESGDVRAWNLDDLDLASDHLASLTSQASALTSQIQYTNAKVLLVGDSGAGKTGLSKVLAGGPWQPTDSTVGAWATQWNLPVPGPDGVEREVWLWDFGGQADQRLIHQLYMDETASVVLVFDGQKDDIIETLGQWDSDLTRAANHSFAKLLVAGRVDAGGLRVSRVNIEQFCREHGYERFMETSAKTGIGCKELEDAILESIRWENIPWRSSPQLFKRMKDEIVKLKDEGRVLMRFNELRERLQLRLSGDDVLFTDQQLGAVITLLTGPGVVWELKFGSWILLQPERVNAYAQAVLQTMRGDDNERGCIPEDRVLTGNLSYQSSLGKLKPDDQRFVLLAMLQTLVERGLCLREQTESGTMLVFPSYYRRERPDLVDHPPPALSYRFKGFVEDVYATLVVRLHHTQPFKQRDLWRYAADFQTLTGKQLGFKLVRRSQGSAEVQLYFEEGISEEERIIFSKYVSEHLERTGTDVVRLRHYICPNCKTVVANREVAMSRLEQWLKEAEAQVGSSLVADLTSGPTILCVNCEKRVPLWDRMEKYFASDAHSQTVRALEQQSARELANESRKRALIGEVISTIALADQICRERGVMDDIVELEVEFRDDAGRDSARTMKLQLCLDELTWDETENTHFATPPERIISEWTRDHETIIVALDRDGILSWIVTPLSEPAIHKSGPPRIRFTGQRFDVMSVRRWRSRAIKLLPNSPLLVRTSEQLQEPA